ncbi:hypothetical protein ACG74X_19440 [Marivita sp. S0852]|uniref:nucleotide-binding protein n=1 Tax=Marivita sp. S0852 TaxID=3373893 RepID=UPI00398295BA
MTKSKSSRIALMMTTSLKGGTGKSTFSCALADYLRTQGYPTAAYDADGSNGSFSSMHATRDEAGDILADQDPLEGVVAYNVRNESRNTLIASCENFSGLVLHDLAGSSLSELQRIFEDGEDGLHNIFQVFADLGVHPIFLHLITPDKATVNSVAHHLDLMDALGDLGSIASHVAVLNQRGNQTMKDFPFWHGFTGADGALLGGKTRARLLTAGGVEMILPHMNERTFAFAKDCHKPLSQAVTDAGLNIVDRQRIKLFNTEFAAAVTSEVRNILGLQHAQ